MRKARTGANEVRDAFGKQRQSDNVAEVKITYMVFPGMVGKNPGKTEYWAIIGYCGKLFNELTEVWMDVRGLLDQSKLKLRFGPPWLSIHTVTQTLSARFLDSIVPFASLGRLQDTKPFVKHNDSGVGRPTRGIGLKSVPFLGVDEAPVNTLKD